MTPTSIRAQVGRPPQRTSRPADAAPRAPSQRRFPDRRGSGDAFGLRNGDPAADADAVDGCSVAHGTCVDAPGHCGRRGIGKLPTVDEGSTSATVGPSAMEAAVGPRRAAGGLAPRGTRLVVGAAERAAETPRRSLPRACLGSSEGRLCAAGGRWRARGTADAVAEREREGGGAVHASAAAVSPPLPRPAGSGGARASPPRLLGQPAASPRLPPRVSAHLL